MAIAGFAGAWQNVRVARGAPPPSPAGDVDRITALQAAITADTAELRQLRTSLEAPDSEYRQAEAELRELIARLEARRGSLGETAPNASEKSDQETDALREATNRARKRLALAIEERKALRSKIGSLELRVAESTDELDRLSGIEVEERAARQRGRIQALTEEVKALQEQLTQATGETLRLGELVSREAEAVQLARQRLANLTGEGAPTAKSGEVAAARSALTAAELRAEAARREAQIAEARQASLADRIAGLEKQLARQRDRLRLLVPPPGEPTAQAGPEPAGGLSPAAPAVGNGPGGGGTKAATPKSAMGEAGGGGQTTASVLGAVGSMTGINIGESSKDDASKSATAAEVRETPELQIARAVAVARFQELKAAQRELAEVQTRAGDLDKLIETERTLLEASSRRATLAEADRRAEQQRLDDLRRRRAPRDEIAQAEERVAAAEERISQAVAAVQRTRQQIETLTKQAAMIQQQRAVASAALSAAAAAAAEAEDAVRRLEDPWSVVSLSSWLKRHGWRVAILLAGIIVIRRRSTLIADRIVALANRSGDAAAAPDRLRDNRLSTLNSVIAHALSLGVVLIGGILLLEELGLNVNVLLGGFAIVGVAVGFGAQNLIRDFFNGFLILSEGQYLVRDVIRVGSLAGQVEAITLRATVLRDIDGTVHFIPNGAITTVSNMTHVWSRALFDVGIPHTADIDAAVAAIRGVANELRTDPGFAPLILEDLEMLGVEQITENAIVLRFFIKTRPIQQWNVKREFLKRLRVRFTQLGIALPMAQQRLYVDPWVVALATPPAETNGTHDPASESSGQRMLSRGKS